MKQEEALEAICFSLGALQNTDFWASSQKFWFGRPKEGWWHLTFVYSSLGHWWAVWCGKQWSSPLWHSAGGEASQQARSHGSLQGPWSWVRGCHSGLEKRDILPSAHPSHWSKEAWWMDFAMPAEVSFRLLAASVLLEAWAIEPWGHRIQGTVVFIT